MIRNTFFPLLLILFIAHCLCIENEQHGTPGNPEMVVWEMKTPQNERDWITKATFHAEYPANSAIVTAGKNEQYELLHSELVKLAKRHFGELQAQEKELQADDAECLRKKLNGDKSCKVTQPDPRNRDTDWMVVAVLYDPTSEWIFASSKPRGPRKDWMVGISHETVEITGSKDKKANEEWAPFWYQNFNPRGSDGKRVDPKALDPHAEDGCYFNWETSEKVHIRKGSNRGRYPNGMMVVAYGDKKNIQNAALSKKPHEMPPCGARGEPRKPATCQEVAQALGVRCKREGEMQHNLGRDFGAFTKEQLIIIWNNMRVVQQQESCPSKPKRLAIRGKGATPPKNAEICKPLTSYKTLPPASTKIFAVPTQHTSTAKASASVKPTKGSSGPSSKPTKASGSTKPTKASGSTKPTKASGSTKPSKGSQRG